MEETSITFTVAFRIIARVELDYCRMNSDNPPRLTERIEDKISYHVFDPHDIKMTTKRLFTEDVSKIIYTYSSKDVEYKRSVEWLIQDLKRSINTIIRVDPEVCIKIISIEQDDDIPDTKGAIIEDL